MTLNALRTVVRPAIERKLIIFYLSLRSSEQLFGELGIDSLSFLLHISERKSFVSNRCPDAVVGRDPEQGWTKAFGWLARSRIENFGWDLLIYTVFRARRITFFLVNRGSFWFSTRFTRNKVIRLVRKTV